MNFGKIDSLNKSGEKLTNNQECIGEATGNWGVRGNSKGTESF